MSDESTNDEEALIFSLSYCSRAIRNLGSAEVEGIVSAARLKNSRHKITGWLTFGSGVFFQWLEGNKDEVKHLMEAIIADTRHDTIVVLSELEDVGERLFDSWDMELVSAEDIREVLLAAISESKDTKNLAALRTLAKEVESTRLKPGLNKLIDL